MRIGIVSQWRNQGQATLSRHLRHALHALGHETFVLARPTRDDHALPGRIDRGDVWDQPNVEHASRNTIPRDEYAAWAKRHAIEACFFNQNYQFDEIAHLRAMGVKTIAYFVWEAFHRSQAKDALRAFDVVYSLNRATQDYYARIGIDSPYVLWGLHPELFDVPIEPRRAGAVTFFFPGGLQGPRKPLKAVVRAIREAKSPHALLVVKAQGEVALTEQVDVGGDPRIRRVVEDLPQAEYYRFFASHDVALVTTRWEGTGMHFFEAIAFGMPMIATAIPPLDEYVRDGFNGRTVKSHAVGHTKSGLPAYDPDVDELAAAIDELCDPAARARMAKNTLAMQAEYPWERTIQDFGALLERACGSRTATSLPRGAARVAGAAAAARTGAADRR